MELFQIYMQAMRTALDINTIGNTQPVAVSKVIEGTRSILDDYQAWAVGITSGDKA